MVEFYKYVKKKKMKGIPNYPRAKYFNHGWKGWKDFLGTG